MLKQGSPPHGGGGGTPPAKPGRWLRAQRLTQCSSMKSSAKCALRRERPSIGGCLWLSVMVVVAVIAGAANEPHELIADVRKSVDVLAAWRMRIYMVQEGLCRIYVLTHP
jgi:hypothetical protein